MSRQVAIFRHTAALALLLVTPVAGLAQTVNATLRGTITDSQGSVVASAALTLVEPATGQIVRSASSLGDGDFEFNELKPGTYHLRCAAPGFKDYVAENIVLDSGQIRRVHAQLAIGRAAEEVTVSEGAA